MTTAADLIETMARAINRDGWLDERADDTPTQIEYWHIQRSIAREKARAALAAIEAAGYRVVPMELTTDQRAACRDCLVDSAEPGDLYAAMLAAAPKHGGPR